MILHDLFDWTNSVIGVAGLALTVGAVWQATGAKKAATDAKEAVYRRNAADAMVEIVRIAEQLNTSVLYERPAEASIQLRELSLRLPKDREEFSNLLGPDGDKLSEMERRFRLWADFLGSGRFPAGAAEKSDLFNETFTTVQELSAIQGRLRRTMDREEK